MHASASRILTRTLATIGIAATVGCSLLGSPAIVRADTKPVNLRELPGVPTLGAANKPAAVRLCGTLFSHAIVGKTPAGGVKIWQLVFDLDGKYSSFSALAGVGDKLGPKAAAVFTLVGDGKVILATGAMHSGDQPYDFDAIDVTGVHKLTLIVKGEQKLPPVVVWGDPKVTPSPAQDAAAPAADSAPAPADATPAPSTPAAPAPVAPAAPSGIAVVPFGAVSDDITDNAATITSMIGKQIAADTSVDVVPNTEVKQEVGTTTGYLSKDDLAKVGQDLGVKYVVTGAVSTVKRDEKSIWPIGKKVVVTVEFDGKVQDAATGQLISRGSISCKTDRSAIANMDPDSDSNDSALLDKAITQAVQQFCAKVEPALKTALAATPK